MCLKGDVCLCAGIGEGLLPLQKLECNALDAMGWPEGPVLELKCISLWELFWISQEPECWEGNGTGCVREKWGVLVLK